MDNTFGWLDVETIAASLVERHPKVDPMRIRFTELKAMIQQLPGFVEDTAHPCNERILETIQEYWIEELEGPSTGDEE